MTSITLYIAEDSTGALAHNTAPVWRKPGEAIIWHVHWEAHGPDSDDFWGRIYRGSTRWRSFTADGDHRTALGGATLDTPVEGATYTIECWVKRVNRGWCVSNGRTLHVADVELEKLSAGNSPDLPPGLICTNAQACYKKAKWKAKTVRPSGTTAKVISSAGVPVTFSGIGGSDPDALSEGDEFWVEEAGETGAYALKLEHNDYNSCTDTNTSGKVFKFEFTATKYDTEGGTCGSGSKNEAAGTVSAPKTTNPAGQSNGADVFWLYHAGVTTVPSGAYSGNVSAKPEAVLDTDGTITIWTNDYDGTMDAFAVTATFGIITVTASTSSGTHRYYTCVAGCRAEIKWDGETPGQSTTEEWDYADVPPPHSWSSSRTWTDGPDIHLTRSGATTTYTVDTTEDDFYVRVGVASNAERPELEFGLCNSNVTTNNNSIASVEVEEEDGTFDIVP